MEKINKIQLVMIISIIILILGTIITISLTNLIESKYSNDEIFNQVTFLYK